MPLPQVFNATSTTASSLIPTRDLLKIVAPNTPIKADLGEYDAPLSNRKIREVLGFADTPEWKWDVEMKKGGVDLEALKKKLLEQLKKDGHDVKA